MNQGDGEKVEIHLKMELDYEEFMANQREEFLNDLAQVANCRRDEVEVVRWQRGCVCVNIKLPKAIADQLFKRYFELIESQEETPETIKLKKFLKKYSVEDLLRQNYNQMQIIVKESPKEKALIFIHGWTGTETAFGNLPTYLSEACDCQSFLYKYPTGYWSHSPSIIFIANEFRNWVLNECPNMKYAILAHSLGGILLRQFLVNESREQSRLDLAVKMVCFLASPHNGAALAGIGEHIPSLRTQQMGDLSPQSPILFQLNRDWRKWVVDHVPTDCRLDSIFGTNDKVVSPSNAIGLSEDVVSILGRTHTDIVKPTSREDMVVKTLIRFLAWADFANKDLRENPPESGPSVIIK